MERLFLFPQVVIPYKTYYLLSDDQSLLDKSEKRVEIENSKKDYGGYLFAIIDFWQ